MAAAVCLALLAVADSAVADPTSEELARSVTPLIAPVEQLRPAPTIRPLAGRVRAGRSVVPSDVLFAFDRAEVRRGGRRALLRLAASVADRPGTMTVLGHTDGVGPSGYNRALSLRRARAVAALLRDGLPQTVAISASGRGSSQPVAAETTPDGEDDPDGRARNRRVELAFRKR